MHHIVFTKSEMFKTETVFVQFGAEAHAVKLKSTYKRVFDVPKEFS